MVNVLHKESPVVETDKQGAVCKKQDKGYYEAFRLLLANLVKAAYLASKRPPTEQAAVRCRLKYECHGRDNSMEHGVYL